MAEKYANVIRLIHEAIEKGVFPAACLEIANRAGCMFRYWEGNRSLYPTVEPVADDRILRFRRLLHNAIIAESFR